MHTLALYGKLRGYNVNRTCLVEVMVLIYWDSCFHNGCCYSGDDDDDDSSDN